jgi:hypothetical protein
LDQSNHLPNQKQGSFWSLWQFFQGPSSDSMDSTNEPHHTDHRWRPSRIEWVSCVHLPYIKTRFILAIYQTGVYESFSKVYIQYQQYQIQEKQKPPILGAVWYVQKLIPVQHWTWPLTIPNYHSYSSIHVLASSKWDPYNACLGWMSTFFHTMVVCVVSPWPIGTLIETLPIINKPKHPKKGGNTRNKMGGPMSKKTKNHLRGQTTRKTSSSWTPSCCEKHIK